MSPTSHDRSDADHWDVRYTDSSPPSELRPPELVVNPPGESETAFANDALNKRVLDVACGWGDAGLFLAQAGADVTLTDVSAVALASVADRAASYQLDVTTIRADLTTDPIPTGAWDVITCAHYLDRTLLPRLGAALAPNGRLAVAIATRTNLDRHQRPSARFLLDPDELPTLVPDLMIHHHSEQWRANGSHEAWLIAGPS